MAAANPNADLAGFEELDPPFTHGAIRHRVFWTGDGSPVLVLHELPGLSPAALRFGRRNVNPAEFLHFAFRRRFFSSLLNVSRRSASSRAMYLPEARTIQGSSAGLETRIERRVPGCFRRRVAGPGRPFMDATVG